MNLIDLQGHLSYFRLKVSVASLWWKVKAMMTLTDL